MNIIYLPITPKKPEPIENLAERIKRIKETLDNIHRLMGELKRDGGHK